MIKIGDTPEQLNVQLASALDVIIVGDKAFSKKDIEALQAALKATQFAAEQLLNADELGDEEDTATIHANMNDVLLKTPAQCLAAHDAEVAKAAVLEFVQFCRPYGNMMDYPQYWVGDKHKEFKELKSKDKP